MGLLDTLSQVIAGGSISDQHFDQMAQNAPPGALGSAIAGAFRSDQTPAIGDMVSQMFQNSNGQQQAGMLNQILATLGPAAAAALAGGALGRILQPGATQVTPDQASQLSPDQVRDVVNHANDAHPGIADQLGNFYAQHSGLVKTLGGAALLVAMTKMKDHLAQR
ncbi:MAG TPA: hypothetical protein VMC81_12410 [Rhodocyclaceae bacterium]|nr:hypothetical protein [Rhodocyclaceae bacterium]